MPCVSYYYLFLFFNGTGEKHRTGLPGRKGGGVERMEGAGGAQGREMTQTMYSHVNK
jgi:hypothetical protein